MTVNDLINRLKYLRSIGLSGHAEVVALSSSDAENEAYRIVNALAVNSVDDGGVIAMVFEADDTMEIDT